MNTAKQEVESLLRKLPENAEVEDIQYHLYVLEKIRRGEARAEEEGALSHQQLRDRLDPWLQS